MFHKYGENKCLNTKKYIKYCLGATWFAGLVSKNEIQSPMQTQPMEGVIFLLLSYI